MLATLWSGAVMVIAANPKIGDDAFFPGSGGVTRASFMVRVHKLLHEGEQKTRSSAMYKHDENGI